MKQRFSSLDVKVIAQELNQVLVGMRAHNVHDLSSLIFLIKFQTSGRREHLIIHLGFRCHLTGFIRTTASEPSMFVKRMRKLLGTRRVTSVSQVGTDRILEFQFSDGLYRLYLEFYAAGNIIITNDQLQVLAVQRTVSEGADHEHVKLGSVYNLSLRQNYDSLPVPTPDRVRQALKSLVEQNSDQATTPSKATKPLASTLRRAIGSCMKEFPPALVQHVLHSSSLDDAVTPQQILQDQRLLDQLVHAVAEAHRISTGLSQAHALSTGYIISKRNAKHGAHDDFIYHDFLPFKPAQFEDDQNVQIEQIDGFNQTVDKFFSSIEGQKLHLRLQERELTAQKKLQHARDVHQQKLGSLQETQHINIRKAEAIVANVDRVSEAVAAVNGLIGQAMDWLDIARLLEAEQNRGNPIARLIKLPLKLDQNSITLLLAQPEAEEDGSNYDSDSANQTSDSDDTTSNLQSKQPARPMLDRLAIDVDLSLSPWANASQYYDQKKVAADKEERTAQASSIALKNVQRKIAADLQTGLKQEKDILRPVRQPFWFEKFYFFISSDSYLVLAGRDRSQNNLIYSRYFSKGDVFVHTDVEGASPVVIKNNPATPDSPIPPSTLSQAGSLSVATSTAWDSKALMAPWWVRFDQVSNIDQHDHLLSPGLFYISGEKNFLPPTQLLLGLAVVWEVSEADAIRHRKHRIHNATHDASSLDLSGVQASAAQVDAGTDHDSSDAREESADGRTDSDADEEDFPDVAPQIDDDSDEEVADTKLDEHPVSSDEKQDEVSSNPSPGSAASDRTRVANKLSHRHLSAKERRLRKKGIETTSSQLTSSLPHHDETAKEDDDDVQSTTTLSKARQLHSQLARGKRTKVKKVAAKYADQDEDDRFAAMAKLGSSSGATIKQNDALAKALAEKQAQADKQRRRNQHLKAQALAKAQDIARKHATSDDAQPPDHEEEQANDLVILNRFVGTLHPEDNVVSGFFLCAPWSALSTYKFKVKLQPGMQKKGKASREILSKWQADSKLARNIDPKAEDMERIWPREAELIQGLRDTDAIGVLPVSRIRVMTSGKNAKGSGDKGKAKGKGHGKDKGKVKGEVGRRAKR